jgi:hypothetical protein
MKFELIPNILSAHDFTAKMTKTLPTRMGGNPIFGSESIQSAFYL